MKNKMIITFLLVFIAGMSGFVIYRISGFFSASAADVEIHDSFVPPALSAAASDTFSIVANYRDPFLARPEARPENNKPKILPQPKKIAEPVKWPPITYGGMIASHGSNTRICIISINGQNSFMKEGSSIGEIFLKKIYKDSIEIVSQKEKKVIIKS